MPVQLVHVGELYDTAKYGLLTQVDELVPTADGGYKVIFERVTLTDNPSSRIEEDFLATVGVTGFQNGSLVKFTDDLRFGTSSLRSDGTLLVSFGMRTNITLGTVDPTGAIKTGYDAALTQIMEPPYSTSDGGVAYGKGGSIAVARIGQDSAGKYRAVDILKSDLKVQQTIILDRDLRTDEAGSTTVTALSDGRFLVTWIEVSPTRADIVVRVVTSAGKIVGTKFVVGSVDGDFVDRGFGFGLDSLVDYAITALPDGAFALNYQEAIKSSYDPSTGSETSVRHLIGQTWIPNAVNGFKVSKDFYQDTDYQVDTLKALITLSDGRMIQIVEHSNDSFMGPRSNIIVKAHLYDAKGNYSGESFDLFHYSNSYEKLHDYIGQIRAVALEDGRFALIVDFENDVSGIHSGVQIYSLSPLPLTIVRGTTGGNDVLKGNARTDLAELLKGGSGDDHLLGYGGSDKLVGGYGNDRLDGGKGADRMEGETGNDTYVVDRFDDIVIEAQKSGIDTVTSSIDYGLGSHVENLILTGSAARTGRGNALNNELTGNNEANVLDGGIGADVMRGWGGDDIFLVDNIRDVVVESAGRGSDTVITTVSYKLNNSQSIEFLKIDPSLNYSGQTISLTGNDAANTLAGSYFSDVLNGKGGADVLTGAGWMDTFVFDSALGNGNVDRITDFASRIDTLRLDDAIFKGLSKGRLAKNGFKDKSKGVVDADDRIIYDPETGHLAYDADGRGGVKAITFAILGEAGSTSHPTVLASDFFIV